jgi:hypothetical protein
LPGARGGAELLFYGNEYHFEKMKEFKRWMVVTVVLEM